MVVMAGSPHILVVDGSLVAYLAASMVLLPYNIRVTSVDPREALAFLDEVHDVNLILIDYHEDDTSGYDLLRELKESPILKLIPVVMAFTNVKPEEIKMCLDAGAVEYVFKPIGVDDAPRIVNYI